MLDFFSIFSKGGILLFCFKGMGLDEKDWESFVRTVNSLNKTVFLQVRKVFQIKNSYISSAIQSLQIMYIPCVWLMMFKLNHLVILSEFGNVLKLFGKILITSKVKRIHTFQIVVFIFSQEAEVESSEIVRAKI